MCGIFGVIDLDEKINGRELDKYISITNLVSYRGPDSYGFYLSEKKNVFLGHRRLAILDLSENGKQPMSFDGITIIYNGEIFNYEELKKDLKSKGFEFHTNTDTEIILKAYKYYGTEAFKYFDGMWAFIIYDEILQRVIISRDRFSLKPLFYLKEKNRYYFASEIKQLLKIAKSKSYNKQKIFNFLKQGLLDFDTDTFFNEIKRFPPAYTWIIDLKEKKIVKENYWHFLPADEVKISEEEAAENLKVLLKNSINKRLRSDVPVGILLSGGLDSSSITATVKNYFQNDVISFSIVSYEENFTEKKYIDILTKNLSVENRQFFIDENIIKERIDKTLEFQDEPFGSLSVVAQYYLFEKIKNETDTVVLLSGQGGDELLGGYLKYFFFFLKESIKKRNFLQFFENLTFSIFNKTVLHQFELSSAKRYIPFLQDRNDDYLIIKGKLEPIWTVETFKERQYLDIIKYSIPVLARYEDRNSMAHSLEVRHPFLDFKLVEFCLNLPNHLKVKNGWLKYILRKAINDLPNEIRWRKDKQGFLIPQDIWIRTTLRNEIISNINKNSLIVKEQIIDLDKFIQYYNLFIKGNKIVHSTDIFSVYILEKWFKITFREVIL